MKGNFFEWVVMAAVAVMSLTGCGEKEGRAEEAQPGAHKTLVAYFSRAGSNYVAGRVVELPVGNTAALAKMIQQKLGADAFEIKTEKAYPTDYQKTTEVAKAEINSNARPKLVGEVTNMEEYDVIILGYPNWWGTMPMAVRSFIEQYDLKGKTIMPFCTHEGSEMGSSERDLRKALPDSVVKPGLPVRGTRIYQQDESIADEVENWLKNIEH